MGVLTELVVADHSDAKEVWGSDSRATDFESIDVRGIDVVKLCSLKSLLLDSAYDRDCPKGFARLAGDNDDGHWVFSVPSDLVNALTEMPPDRLSEIAAKWHATKEFRLDRWSLKDVDTALQQIYSICCTSQSRGKSVLMWMSL